MMTEREREREREREHKRDYHPSSRYDLTLIFSLILLFLRVCIFVFFVCVTDDMMI